jgi:succinate dehydrogenase / fumarate reductase, cytochrome b subunit
MRERPLSPHVTIYRMSRYSLLSSITNRVTGVVLSLGVVVLTYWLLAIAGGGRTYLRASGALASRPAKVLYALLIVSFAYHLAAGIRHLIWDAGYALERRESRRSAGFVLAATIVLALAFGYWAFVGRVGT